MNRIEKTIDSWAGRENNRQTRTRQSETSHARSVTAPDGNASNDGVHPLPMDAPTVDDSHPRRNLISRHHVAFKRATAWTCLALSIMEAVFEPPQDGLSLAFGAIHCALLAVFPWSPRACSLALVVEFAIAMPLPLNGGPAEYWGVWLALGYIGYSMRTWIGAVAVTVSATEYICMILSRGLHLGGYIMLPLAMIAFWIAGRCLRWNDETTELARSIAEREAENKQLKAVMAAWERNEKVSLRIHDDVASHLAAVAMGLETNIRSAGCETDRAAMQEAHSQIIAVLGDVRSIITMLRDEAEPVDATDSTPPVTTNTELHGKDSRNPVQPIPAPAAATPTAQIPTAQVQEIALDGWLREQTRRHDAQLAQLGLHGLSLVSCPADAKVDGATTEIIHSFLDEMYTNISVHGITGANSYLVSITCTGKELTVEQSNPIGANGAFADKPSSGLGLELHTQQIERAGGTVVTSRTSDAWSLVMHMPLD